LHNLAIGRRACPALLSSLAAAVLLWPAGALSADSPPAFTSLPTIQGDAVVGATLTAKAEWTGEPTPQVRYQWRRCPATGGACVAIVDAIADKYVVTAADVGSRLGVRVQLKSKGYDAISATSVTTAVVVPAPPPSSGPPPTSDPPPTSGPPPSSDPPPAAPDPKDDPVTPSEGKSFVEPVAPIVTPVVSASARATLLRPFPVVRIRGFFQRGGVRITLLSVNGPRSARITVTCVGRGCPVSSLSLAGAPARLRAFERFLPAGTVLQVRVTGAGRIGKYARFLIRARSAPLRRDLCLMPGRAKPAACPSS
jgi:hypothetical protein